MHGRPIDGRHLTRRECAVPLPQEHSVNTFTGTSSGEPAKRRVMVVAEPAAAVTQPEDFHLCPLGLQFHTTRAIAPFTVLEVDIEVSDASGRRHTERCTGAVVRCQADKIAGRYRIWLQFLELPDHARESLRCTAREGQFLCSYCRNF